MRNIGLMIVPGGGYGDISVSDSMTVADLVMEKNLHGRSITLDGEEVSPDAYSTRTLSGVSEVWATGGAKGA